MSNKKQKDKKERMLDAPLLSFEIEKHIKQLKNEPPWVSGDRNAITLLKTPRLRVVLVALRKGASLREHHAKGPITLFVLSGIIRFSVGEQKCKLESKDLVALDKAIPHDVEAMEDSAFLLTIVQP
ncbi:MAG: cupin domain-containing protein [Ignavibacteriales bacterium]